MEKKISTNKVKVPGLNSMDITIINEYGPFRFREILVSKEVGQNFFVTDIKIDEKSQFISLGAVPASFFTDSARQKNIYFSTLSRDGMLELSVTNIHQKEQEFSAVLTGDVLEDHLQVDTRDRHFMGLGHTIVPSGGTTMVNLRAQIVFKPDGLIVPPEVSDNFIVQYVKVDNEYVKKSECEFESFEAHKLQIADWICVSITNKTNIAKAFYGTVVGEIPYSTRRPKSDG
jgi:hypothetical protein